VANVGSEDERVLLLDLGGLERRHKAQDDLVAELRQKAKRPFELRRTDEGKRGIEVIGDVIDVDRLNGTVEGEGAGLEGDEVVPVGAHAFWKDGDLWRVLRVKLGLVVQFLAQKLCTMNALISNALVSNDALVGADEGAEKGRPHGLGRDDEAQVAVGAHQY
jgi:hypothetical protein